MRDSLADERVGACHLLVILGCVPRQVNEEARRVIERQLTRRRYTLMRELEERGRSGVKQMLEQALEAVAQPHRLLATSFNEDASRVSPDGHYLAYQSDETGRY